MFTSAVLCLAMIISNEAGGEHEQGKVAVAKVVINRAKTHKNICKTVYQKNQFYTKKVNVKSKTWTESKSIAEKILKGKYKDPTHGSTYFHNHTVKPKWANHHKRVVKIGRHTFYKHKEL